MPEICVVHLVWAPLGPGPLERFAASYRRYPAGKDHRLVLVFKQFRDAEALRSVERLMGDVDHERVEMPERKLDLAAYRAVAEQIPAHRFLFLNSTSELLDGDWLAKLDEPFRAPDVGLVGATASYESLLPRFWPLRMLRSRSFTPFPNPHVRTNAFMIERSLMRSLWWPQVRTKTGAWKLENGKRSVTRQVWERDLRAVVVARDATTYDCERWPESRTFRSGEQENLLIADNRTRQYVEAVPEKRRWLASLAWGDGSVPRPEKP
jgi:hypothetical protein